MLVWLLQLVVGEIIHASEMTQCEGKLPCYITCFSNQSCYLDEMDLTYPSLEFNTSCTYFKIDITRKGGLFRHPKLLNDDGKILYDVNLCFTSLEFCDNSCSCEYQIINKTNNISKIQIAGFYILVNYFECLTPLETPIATPNETPIATPTDTPNATPYETPNETPIETPSDSPSETLNATPNETPLSTPNETPIATPIETPNETPIATPIAKRSSSKNKYIIGFTIGFGLPIIIVAITVTIYLRKTKKQVDEEVIVDDIQYPENDSKKEDDQENPLYVLNGSHDPFDEITE